MLDVGLCMHIVRASHLHTPRLHTLTPSHPPPDGQNARGPQDGQYAALARTDVVPFIRTLHHPLHVDRGSPVW